MKLTSQQLTAVKDRALDEFKNRAAPKGMNKHEFLSVCWISATLWVLNGLGLTDLELEIETPEIYEGME